MNALPLDKVVGILGLQLALACSSATTTAEPKTVQQPARVEMTSGALDGVSEGEPAPNFVAVDQDGKSITLSQLRGQTVVLFFYTRDETPSTIREVLDFRDRFEELKEHKVTVLGLSTDTLEAHEDFARRLKLPFSLLADTEGTIAKAFGVPVSYGIGERQTIVIDEAGEVKRIYRNVDLTNHVAELVMTEGAVRSRSDR